MIFTDESPSSCTRIMDPLGTTIVLLSRVRMAVETRFIWLTSPKTPPPAPDLWGEIPDLQGEYREILRNQTLLTASSPRFPNLDAVMATDSLCS